MTRLRHPSNAVLWRTDIFESAYKNNEEFRLVLTAILNKTPEARAYWRFAEPGAGDQPPTAVSGVRIRRRTGDRDWIQHREEREARNGDAAMPGVGSGDAAVEDGVLR